jgi:hypothetical protein
VDVLEDVHSSHVTSTTNMIRALSSPHQRIVYAVAETSESLTISPALAHERAIRGQLP